MSVEDSETFKEIRASHDLIDTAIREHVEKIGIEGIITGWVLTAAITSFDEDAEELDGLYSTQSNGLSKWPMIGMLRIALKSAEEEGFQVNGDWD